MISTDRLIFDKESGVALRQMKNAKDWEAVHIVVFALKNINYPKSVSLSENCHIYSTDSNSKLHFPFDAIYIGKKVIIQNNITHITCQDPSLTAMVGVALKKKFRIPLEIQIHADIGSLYFAKSWSNKIRLHMAKKYLPKADKIRAVSGKIKDFAQALLQKRGLNTPIVVRPIVIDEGEIKSSPVVEDLHKKYKQFDHIVLMASRIEKEKNIEMAITAWAGIIKDFPRAGLVIVGSGSELVELKHIVVSKKLDKSVIFEDWVDKKTLYSYYKTADIFLNTSFYEGYGMTLVEARAAGCPIVSTDVGVASEIGATIAGFDHFDVEQKVKAILSQKSNKNHD